MNTFILLLSTLFFCLSTSQAEIYRIHFKSKGATWAEGNPLYLNTLAQFSNKALERRSKVRLSKNIIDLKDAPIHNTYIDSISSIGGKIFASSRWQNYVVAEVDSTLYNKIKNWSFVDTLYPARKRLKLKKQADSTHNTSKSKFYYEDKILLDCEPYQYGVSRNQLEMMGINKLHRMAFDGEGALIGFADTGFRWKTHKGTQNARVIAEYDFIYKDSVTANEFNKSANFQDVAEQDNHGSQVFSTVAASLNGKLIGAAPSADFLLSKTEDMRGETRIEEDYLAMAIEWMEAQGADVITSSLGYLDFPSADTSESYKYSELLGKNSISALAYNRATELGVICVASAGNNGRDTSVITPADADSCIAVAALQGDGKSLAGFSSRGPRYDGALKPNIAAMGNQVTVIRNGSEEEITAANGTSFAAPLIAGAMGLLISAYPELTTWQARELLYQSASNYENPNFRVGYGLPNMMKSFLNAGFSGSPISYYRISDYVRVILYAVNRDELDSGSIYIKFNKTGDFESFPLIKSLEDLQWYADVPVSKFNENAIAYYNFQLSNLTFRTPKKGSEYFEINPEINKIKCGIDIKSLTQIIDSRTSAYIYPQIVTEIYPSFELKFVQRQEGITSITIFDLNGNIVYVKELEYVPQGVKNIDLHLEKSVAQGTYFVSISKPEGSELVKFIVIR